MYLRHFVKCQILSDDFFEVSIVNLELVLYEAVILVGYFCPTELTRA